jgi:hypothetical protein
MKFELPTAMIRRLLSYGMWRVADTAMKTEEAEFSAKTANTHGISSQNTVIFIPKCSSKFTLSVAEFYILGYDRMKWNNLNKGLK